MSKNHLLYSVSEMEMVYQQQIQPARRAQLSSSGGGRDDAACASGTRSPSSDTAESPLVRISIHTQERHRQDYARDVIPVLLKKLAVARRAMLCNEHTSAHTCKGV